MHSQYSLEYRAADQNAPGSGYVARCTCGRWQHDAIIHDPSQPSQRQEADAAWTMHAATAED